MSVVKYDIHKVTNFVFGEKFVINVTLPFY